MRNNRLLSKVSGICVLGLYLTLGCGITSQSFLTQAAGKKIFVQDVENTMDVVSERNDFSQHRSIPPGLERRLRVEIINRLQTEGYLKVVNSKQDADIVLKTQITDYLREAVTVKDNNVIEDYRLIITGSAMFSDTHTNGEISKIQFTADSSYEIGSSRDSNSTSAVDLLISRAARKVADALLDQW